MEPNLLGRKAALITPSHLCDNKRIWPVFFSWLVVIFALGWKLKFSKRINAPEQSWWIFFSELNYRMHQVLYCSIMYFGNSKSFISWKVLSTWKIKCIPETSNSAPLQHITFAMLSPFLTAPDYAWSLDFYVKNARKKNKIFI